METGKLSGNRGRARFRIMLRIRLLVVCMLSIVCLSPVIFLFWSLFERLECTFTCHYQCGQSTVGLDRWKYSHVLPTVTCCDFRLYWLKSRWHPLLRCIHLRMTLWRCQCCRIQGWKVVISILHPWIGEPCATSTAFPRWCTLRCHWSSVNFAKLWLAELFDVEWWWHDEDDW